MATVDDLVAQLIKVHRETADRLENLRKEYQKKKDAEMLKKTRDSIGSLVQNEDETDFGTKASTTMRGRQKTEVNAENWTKTVKRQTRPTRRDPPAEVSTKDQSQASAKLNNRAPSVNSAKAPEKKETPQPEEARESQKRPPSARRNPVQVELLPKAPAPDPSNRQTNYRAPSASRKKR